MLNEDELKSRISNLPDEELLQMVYADHDQYHQEALAYARAEVTRRGLRYSLPEPSIEQEERPPEEKVEYNPMLCPHCATKLNYVGTKRFHEGTHWGVLGELGELFTNREHFDVYVCPRCGRVEFFVEGIGEEYRPH